MSFRFPDAALSNRSKASLLLVVCPLALLMLLVVALLSCSGRKQSSQDARTTDPPRQTQPTEQAMKRHVLRVCADPNNLPFSNQRREGFENRIAELVAREMNLTVEYTWWAQRRGFIRNTLRAGLCDVVIGVPSSFELALTTAPYYRSTYAFVYRKGRGLNIRSFDDRVLRNLKIGVQMIGDDSANSPPAHALSNRHIIENVKGYGVYGDYAQPNPPARIVEAVSKGEVDVAVVWGPLAGYFAKRQRVPLEVVPVSPQIDLPFLPFVFDISIGVRRGDNEFKEQLEEILSRKSLEIESILDEYNVPRVGAAERQAGS
jgi:quinoprotein dehydrogenase-associated probable ABC transporter substrate-binding protein